MYIENNKNIKDYFLNTKFDKCETVFFNWIIYNDNNLITYDNRSLIERFTHPALNHSSGKSFVRGNIENVMVPTSHMPGINVHQFCNSKGENIYPKNFLSNIFEENPKAYIKHYYTKTIEEFCNKINRGDAHFHKNHPNYISTIKNKLRFFYQLNKITKEKINNRYKI